MEEHRERDSNAEELNNLEVTDNPAKDFFYFLFDLFKTGLIVFVLAFSLRYFVIQPFIVDGESMMPNYVNNEYLLAEKVSYIVGKPKRGDVVVFRYPGNPNINYIKRIIGLPGETVRIENSQVIVSNSQNPYGEVLGENYLPKETKTLTGNSGDMERTLGPGEYFVMGDNRQHSSDSREWGVLPYENILGRSWLTVMPVDRFQIHRHAIYPGPLGALIELRRLAAKI
ncbi:MAG: signal peptidase I [Patescibacteria group bacterium]|mgnify:CR=1 FL=1